MNFCVPSAASLACILVEEDPEDVEEDEPPESGEEHGVDEHHAEEESAEDKGHDPAGRRQGLHPPHERRVQRRELHVRQSADLKHNIHTLKKRLILIYFQSKIPISAPNFEKTSIKAQLPVF